MAPCLQGQHRSSAQVGVTWRLDAPDSTAMLTPRRSLSSLASLQLRGLYGDFDAALVECGGVGSALYLPALPGSAPLLCRRRGQVATS